MLFKYSKSIITPETVPAEDYALYGTMALSAYIRDYGKNQFLIDEAIKWYTSALNSQKNEETALFGLIQSLMMKKDFQQIKEYEKQLKKYHKSYKFLKECLKKAEKCYYTEDKTECGSVIRKQILDYLYYLNKTNK